MTDWTELKRLAEEASWTGRWYDAGCNTVMCTYVDKDVSDHDEIAHPCPLGITAYIAAVHPAAILTLIAENERLQLIVEASEEVERQLQQNADVERIRADNWRDNYSDWSDRCIAAELERDKLRAEVEPLRRDAELLDKLEETVKIGSRSVPPHGDDSWQGIYAFRTQLQGRTIREALWSATDNEPAYMDYVRELNSK